MHIPPMNQPMGRRATQQPPREEALPAADAADLRHRARPDHDQRRPGPNFDGGGGANIYASYRACRGRRLTSIRTATRCTG